MDLSDLGQLPIPIAALAIVAVFAYIILDRLFKIVDATLKMFDSHKEALDQMASNMQANTEATKEMAHLVKSLNSK